MDNQAEVGIVRRWSLDPLLFVTEALKVKTLSTQQKQGFEELRKLVWAKIKSRDGKKLTSEEESYAKKIGISIMSGMGTGKDAFCSMAILWFLCCFPRALIPCTAPTGHQLTDVLWREINKWRMGDHDDPPIIKDWIVWQTQKVYFAPEQGREWYAVGRTANPKGTSDEQAETLQGFHEKHMMIIVDEASGVPEPVFTPLEGTLTEKCNFILMIFNPTRSQGYAIESQTKYRDKWICLHWDAEESELVTRESIESKAKYGRDSNFFRVTVKGYPPKSTSDTLVPWEWAIEATNRDLIPMPDDPDIFGVDVGAGGDPSVICHKQGPLIHPFRENDTPDSEILTGWLMRRIYDDEPKMVYVDTIGIGWGIEGNLRHRLQGRSTTIVGIAVSESPSNNDRFYKLRDELAWNVREKFERKMIAIPDDPGLLAELTTIRFTEPHGKIKLESKKDLRKRLRGSPNKFDSLCLSTYYDEQTVRVLGNRKQGNWRQRVDTSSWRTV